MTRIYLVFIATVLVVGKMKTQSKKDSSTIERDFQITFITPMGTNGIESLNAINKVSINIFGGGAKGVNGIEVGGFVNFIKKDVKGLQAAGFANVVLGSVKGSQLAGFVNYSADSLIGLQAAGFCNANFGELRGAQLAGFCNYNQRNFKGIQGSGFANVSLDNFYGAQLSGFANVTHGNIDGVQASGFFNYAKKVKGIQLGFLNFADSVDGVAIGFLSFSRKGLHQIELSSDEVFYTNVSVRTGGYGFYNILSTGFSPKNGTTLWNVGYGAGTSIKINEKLRSDIILSAQHVSKGLFYNGTSELYKLYLVVEYKLAKKCFVAAGPTFNLYFGDTLLPDFGTKYSQVAPYSILNETNSDGFNFKGWIGGKIAIRFL